MPASWTGTESSAGHAAVGGMREDGAGNAGGDQWMP